MNVIQLPIRVPDQSAHYDELVQLLETRWNPTSVELVEMAIAGSESPPHIRMIAMGALQCADDDASVHHSRWEDKHEDEYLIEVPAEMKVLLTKMTGIQFAEVEA